MFGYTKDSDYNLNGAIAMAGHKICTYDILSIPGEGVLGPDISKRVAFHVFAEYIKGKTTIWFDNWSASNNKTMYCKYWLIHSLAENSNTASFTDKVVTSGEMAAAGMPYDITT